jgi:membrane protease YdiL (CAAX protease family)
MIQNGSMDIQNQLNGILMNPIVLLCLTLILYVFCFIVFYIFARLIHKRKFRSFINLDSKIDWMKIFKGAGLWLIILGAFTLLSFIFNPGAYKFTFNPNTFGILLLITIIGIPIQASFEEIFFRGYLMQGFALWSKKPIIPLLATSILFAILHGANGINSLVNVFIVLQILLVGLMLGIIALGENRIETAMGVHIANNLFVFLVVGSSDEVMSGLPSIFTAAPSTTSDLFMGLLSTLIAVIIVLTIIFWGKKDKLLNIFSWKDAKNETDDDTYYY